MPCVKGIKINVYVYSSNRRCTRTLAPLSCSKNTVAIMPNCNFPSLKNDLNALPNHHRAERPYNFAHFSAKEVANDVFSYSLLELLLDTIFLVHRFVAQDNTRAAVQFG